MVFMYPQIWNYFMIECYTIAGMSLKIGTVTLTVAASEYEGENHSLYVLEF